MIILSDKFSFDAEHEDTHTILEAMIIKDYIPIMLFSTPTTQNQKNVAIWLFFLTFLIFLMIIIGGLTRLTESGLSMVDWRPIMGIIPPLSNESWIKVFSAYQSSPEFIIVNQSMNLDEFKYIFWWEWFHRFFARFIGMVFILPLILAFPMTTPRFWSCSGVTSTGW